MYVGVVYQDDHVTGRIVESLISSESSLSVRVGKTDDTKKSGRL